MSDFKKIVKNICWRTTLQPKFFRAKKVRKNYHNIFFFFFFFFFQPKTFCRIFIQQIFFHDFFRIFFVIFFFQIRILCKIQVILSRWQILGMNPYFDPGILKCPRSRTTKGPIFSPVLCPWRTLRQTQNLKDHTI